MKRIRIAGTAAATLLLAVAGLQVALALRAPFGDAVMGGRAQTVDGVLTPGYRALAALQGLLLVALAGVLLARAGIIDVPKLGPRRLGAAAWAVVGLMALNTVGNLASSHPFERWVLGPTTLAVACLAAVVARRPLPSRGSPGEQRRN